MLIGDARQIPRRDREHHMLTNLTQVPPERILIWQDAPAQQDCNVVRTHRLLEQSSAPACGWTYDQSPQEGTETLRPIQGEFRGKLQA